jgi:hypothetical protein
MSENSFHPSTRDGNNEKKINSSYLVFYLLFKYTHICLYLNSFFLHSARPLRRDHQISQRV